MTQNRVEEIVLLTREDQIRRQQSSPNPRRKKFVDVIKPNNRENCYKNILLWVILFGSLFIIVAPLSLHLSYELPKIRSRTISPEEFSEERARDYYPNLTEYGPRVINTNADFMTRRFLISELSRLESIADPSIRFELSLQNFTLDDHRDLQNIALRVSNVNSLADSPCVTLVAHYDSVEFSPGGSDDGSGVVVALEILSNLIHDRRIDFLKVNLIVLFTSGEEAYLAGATKFIANHPWKEQIRRFINLDSTGGQEKAILFRAKPSQLINEYKRVPRPHANVIGDEVFDYTNLVTDYNVFISPGSLMGYDFAFYLDGYNYHTPLDKPSIVEDGALQHLGENTLVLVRAMLLGHINLDEPVTIADDDEIIYFDILGRHLITYRKSTSVIIQYILIGLVILIGIVIIIIDHLWYNKHPSNDDTSSVYFYFQNPLILRLLLIFLFLLGYVLSMVISLLFSLFISWIVANIRSASWYGSSALAFFLFGLSCCIGLVLCEALWRYLRRILLARYPKKTPMEMKMIAHIDLLCFNFERHLALLFVFVLLMILPISTGFRSLYMILLWAIFVCPIYSLIMLIEFILRWTNKKKLIILNDSGWYWLFAPYIVSLVPLIHTFEMTSRLTRLVIPNLGIPIVSLPISPDLILCALIVIPAVIFLLMFIPNLQKTMNFTGVLILLIISFIIVLFIAFTRQNFSAQHPLVVSVEQNSEANVEINQPSFTPMRIPIDSERLAIKMHSSNHFPLSTVLKRIHRQTGETLRNITCSSKSKCSVNCMLNTTAAFEQIELIDIFNQRSFRFISRHIPTSNVDVRSDTLESLVVINKSERNRSSTIIDVVAYEFLSSFTLTISIGRCDVNDSDFLRFFIFNVSDIVFHGDGRCRTMTDTLYLTVRL